ncbi:hypothetical protein F4780DRAFT_770319 [Xylariomycetidae sp. FL0641]|nr:hypothetical protein F4780DRAFT_770319 [Xylariomycetidae sp. FL0641]
MTEKLPSLLPHSLPPSQTAVFSPRVPPVLPNHALPKAQAPAEEEPYTIKCICNFTDDDGNTIYCEVCDTWQHIECYYPYNMEEALSEDFAHACADCKPRPLDRQRAFERQTMRQHRVSTAEAPERKPATKRPPSKGQKKKAKPSDVAVNGHSGSDTNKSKSSHRPSQSISSQNPKRTPPYSQKTANPHGHPPSPATTPPDLPYDVEIHNYSPNFVDLHKSDREVRSVDSNSFASLIISNVLSLWLRDHRKLREETGCNFNEVFQPLPLKMEDIAVKPKVESKKLPVSPNTVIQWQYLTTDQPIDKDVPLVELNGQIGIQKNYCEDPENRWQELSSPLPFVFFHPLLPIYIDTRREGSDARYVRRSCRPNATMDTFLSDGSEYHFWLISDRKIEPNEHITIPWEFRFKKDVARSWSQLLGLSDETDRLPEFNEKDIETYQSIASWVYIILSEYGGCACDLGSDCAFARFHRNYIARPQAKEKGSKSKKPRKTKPNNISPTSTGHATNSRAPSEGQADDGAENDSGSSRSKPPSRDRTPARQGSFDTMGGVLTELTDRDKRKVQMVEDSFRRMEQQQPPRKKKRASDGPAASGPGAKSKSKSVPNQGNLSANSADRRYVDAGTSGRSISRSPTSVISPNSTHPAKQQGRLHSMPLPSRHSSRGPRPEYCDASVQTDPVDGEWFSVARQTPKTKKRVVSLSKRLLESRHRLRAGEAERRKTATASPTASPTTVASSFVKMGLESPKLDQSPADIGPVEAEKGPSKPSPSQPAAPVDSVMTDAPSISLKATKRSPLPETSAAGSSSTAKTRSPELRVDLPPVPIFSVSSTVGSVTTPVSANGSIAQSPFSSGNLPSPFAPPAVNGVSVTPSPVKKKLSLSDYTKSRMNKAAAARPAVPSLKPPVPSAEDAKSPESTDTVMLDSAPTDKAADA